MTYVIIYVYLAVRKLNPFLPNVPFDPPENIRKPKVF